MKKVFAFLSVFTLAIAMLGFSAKTSAVADSKFTKDPTINENDIPMYIMDSIYTTFPNFYDNDAKADPNWAGSARMYPWNETRLQVRQIDNEGSFTGKEFAVFFSGSLKSTEAGAGNNILFYDVDSDGNTILKRMDGGKTSVNIGAKDPSLSHMRTNISGKDLTFDPVAVHKAANSGAGTVLYNRGMVFDGEGHMVRGITAGANAYENPSDEAQADPYFKAEYCYVDGVVAERTATTTCDKLMVEKVDEDGDPVLDKDGNVVLEESNIDHLVTDRFVWQYVSKEVYESEDFVGVNKVPYLSKGWDAAKWDYAKEETNGYVLIAFTSGEGKNLALTPEQLEVYTATCKANGVADDKLPTAATIRECARMITVPKGGFTYDIGYLDKQKPNLTSKFNEMCHSGYLYGRNETTVDGKKVGMAYQITVNFSAKPLYTVNKVADGNSYQLLEGRNVIEVMAGSTFKPSQNVVYNGLANYWQTPNDLTSYKSDASVLDLYIKVNGTSHVRPVEFESLEQLRDSFIKDFRKYQISLKELEGFKYVDTTGSIANFTKTVDGKETTAAVQLICTPTKEMTDEQIVDYFFKPLDWDLCGTKFDPKDEKTPYTFVNVTEYKERYSFMFDYIAKHSTSESLLTITNGAVASPGALRIALYGFLTESPQRSVAGSAANTCGDWSTGVAREWTPDLWDTFVIDTAGAPINTNYEVVYKCVNTETKVESELTINYVVVDNYTPILKVNKDNLNVVPKVIGDTVTVDPIDPYTLVTAYDGAYSDINKAMVGNEITQNVVFTPVDPSFSFDAPTEGRHLINATITNGNKSTTKTFELVVEDITKPRVFTRDVTLQYGSDFYASAGITFAEDNVDGNLLKDGQKDWFVDMSKNKVKTTKPGKYTVSLRVYDKSGNYTEVSYNAVVLEATNLDDVNDNIEGVLGKLDEQQSAIDELKEALGAVETKVDAVKDSAASQCGSKSAGLVAFLTASSLLVVFLRRKH